MQRTTYALKTSSAIFVVWLFCQASWGTILSGPQWMIAVGGLCWCAYILRQQNRAAAAFLCQREEEMSQMGTPVEHLHCRQIHHMLVQSTTTNTTHKTATLMAIGFIVLGLGWWGGVALATLVCIGLLFTCGSVTTIGHHVFKESEYHLQVSEQLFAPVRLRRTLVAES